MKQIKRQRPTVYTGQKLNVVFTLAQGYVIEDSDAVVVTLIKPNGTESVAVVNKTSDNSFEIDVDTSALTEGMIGANVKVTSSGDVYSEKVYFADISKAADQTNMYRVAVPLWYIQKEAPVVTP